MKFSPYAKAVVGALIAGLSAFGVALEDGTVTGPEWLTVASAALVGLGVVYRVPNKKG